MDAADSRQRSFSAWPYKKSKKYSKDYVKTLIEAGFSLSATKGQPDRCCCYLCGATCSDWAADHDPFLRHAAASPRCALVILHKSKLVAAKNNADNDEAPWSKSVLHARIRTFTNAWPHSDSISVEKMASAGFSYNPDSNSDDNVQCIYCGIQLDGWEDDDDPRTEHLNRKPNCIFLSGKGNNFKNVEEEQDDNQENVEKENMLSDKKPTRSVRLKKTPAASSTSSSVPVAPNSSSSVKTGQASVNKRRSSSPQVPRRRSASTVASPQQHQQPEPTITTTKIASHSSSSFADEQQDSTTFIKPTTTNTTSSKNSRKNRSAAIIKSSPRSKKTRQGVMAIENEPFKSLALATETTSAMQMDEDLEAESAAITAATNDNAHALSPPAPPPARRGRKKKAVVDDSTCQALPTSTSSNTITTNNTRDDDFGDFSMISKISEVGEERSVRPTRTRTRAAAATAAATTTSAKELQLPPPTTKRQKTEDVASITTTNDCVVALKKKTTRKAKPKSTTTATRASSRRKRAAFSSKTDRNSMESVASSICLSEISMCDSESVLEEYVDGIDDEVSVADDGESFNESSFVEHSFLDGVVKEGGREEDGIFDQVHEIFGANAPALFNGQLVGITSVSDVDMNLLDDEHFAQNVPVSTTENSSSPGSSSIKKSNKRISSTHTPTVTTSSSPSYEEITASTCRLESEIFSRLSELPDIQDMTVEQVAKCIVEMEVEELRREGQRMKGLFSSTVAKLLTN